MAQRRTSVTARPQNLFKNIKDAATATDIQLNDQGFSTLAGFEALPLLETLELRNNKLTTLAGLGSNVALKSIDATGNEIEVLQGSDLAPLINLRKVILAKNKLQDLEAMFLALEALPSLRELDLSGCPLTEVEGYRSQVILRLNDLEMLDGEATGEERSALLKPPTPRLIYQEGKKYPEVKDNKELLPRLRLMLRDMRKAVKGRRILLRPDFTDVDRRKEECVPEATFLQILDLYHLLPKPKSLENLPIGPEHIVANVSDVAILLSYYGVGAPVRCRLGRDRNVQDQYFVDYVSFCRDVEPRVGGRDADNRERLMETAWKEKAPAISECLKRLRKDVQVVKTRKDQEREDAWKALASASLTRPRTDSHVPYKPKNTSPTKLGAWELAELRKLLAAKDTNKAGVLGVEDVRTAVGEMESRGRKVGALGGDLANVAELQAAIEAVKKPDGKVPWKAFWAGVEEDVGAFANVQWTRLTPQEAFKRSRELFRQAAALNSRLGLGAMTEKEAKDVEAQVQQLAQLATRLEEQANSGAPPQPAKNVWRAGSEGVGRRDYVQTLTYLPAVKPAFRRAVSDGEGAGHQRSNSTVSTGAADKAKQFRERFGVTDALVESYGVKRQLKEGRRAPYPASREVI